MEKIDEKERFEKDRAFYQLAWNDGYDKGMEDAECGKPAMVDHTNLEMIDTSTTLSDIGWAIGYVVGYKKGVYERSCATALKIKEEREDGKKHG